MILLFCGAISFAQERVSPLSDYQYTRRDLPRYEEIKKETDPQKLVGLLIEFMKDRPINRLLPYILQDYQNVIAGHLGKQEWDRATTLIGDMQAVLPTDKAVEDEEIPVGVEEFMQQLRQARLVMQQLTLSTYYASGNWAKAAELQEQLHAAAPSLQGLQLLADIYEKMQNTDKYLETAQKIMAEVPISQPLGFSMAYQSAQVHLQKNNIPAATEMYKKLMDAYGDKLPEGLTDAQWNPQRAIAYTLLAQEPYTAKDYPKALELFERVVKADPSNGDAYYYIGLCKWQIEGQDGAIEPFARSVVLNKATAPRARQQLEQIYKAKNPEDESLGGLDEILAKAKASLGI
jgi:tetratricopeptide (TPR) repeat protein